jgi:Ca-activated chloride channel family protein
MRSSVRFLCFAAFLSMLPVPASDPPIRADTRMVLVPVTVTDRSGKTVTGLLQDQFELFEDNAPREITSFSIDQQAFSVMVVFDLSGSMRYEIQRSLSALNAFFDLLEPADQVAMVTFAGAPVLRHDFSSDLDAARQSLLHEQVGGGTALVDAIYMGLSKVQAAGNPRKALLVISDGEDNQSRYTAQELSRYALEADAQIYTIAVRRPPASAKETFTHRAALSLLENLASQTGGLHFAVRHPRDLEGVMTKIGSALRDQYMLGFIPADARRDGKWRRIRVNVNPPAQFPKIRISARPGYHDR